MHQHKAYFILAGISAMLLLASCRKDNSPSESIEADDCVTGRGAQDGAVIEGRYIVSFKPGSLDARSTSGLKLAEASTTVLKKHAIGTQALEETFGGAHAGFVARLSASEAESLKNDESVSVVEPDRIVALSVCFTVAEPRLITWSVNRVGYGDGTGKTAWIIDSGIDPDHPDLNVDVNRSRSFITSKPSSEDENGHGTHVAGIIGAKNNNIGLLGVASGASLVSLRVLDKDGKGSLSSIIRALSYINNNARAGDVVNISLGEDIVSETLDQQVKYTASLGIFIAIAAGNDKKPAINFSPGRANGPNIFTVSAIDTLDRMASFSNYGNDAVDLAAPGVRILSTYLNGRYAILSGTSMAAPHVAGLLLLKGSGIGTSGTARNDPDGTPDPIAHF